MPKELEVEKAKAYLDGLKRALIIASDMAGRTQWIGAEIHKEIRQFRADWELRNGQELGE